MAVEEALYSRLTSDVAVSALVGSRVYNTRLPQGPTLPCVTYTRVSTVADMAHDGPVGYELARYQIDAYATTFETIRSLADAVRNCLNGYSGTVLSTVIHAVLLDDQVNEWGDLLDVWRITQDYMIHWRRI